jgi:hypothetical protein
MPGGMDVRAAIMAERQRPFADLFKRLIEGDAGADLEASM